MLGRALFAIRDGEALLAPTSAAERARTASFGMPPRKGHLKRSGADSRGSARLNSDASVPHSTASAEHAAAYPGGAEVAGVLGAHAASTPSIEELGRAAKRPMRKRSGIG